MRTSIITAIVMCLLWIYIKVVAVIYPTAADGIWFITVLVAFGGMLICGIILIVELVKVMTEE